MPRAKACCGTSATACGVARVQVARIVRRGLRYPVTCETACRVSSRLRISGRIARRLDLGEARTTSRRGRAGSSRTAMLQAGVKRLRVTVVTAVGGPDGSRRPHEHVVLRR